MTTSLFVRRSVAVLASAGAATALTLVPQAGAHAAVKAEYFATATANAQYTGTGGFTCDLTSAPGSDDVTSSTAAFTHGTKRRSATANATFTNSGVPTDTVKVKSHVDSALTVKKHGRDLSSLTMTAGGSVKITHSIFNSDCRASGEAVGIAQPVTFTEHKKGWLYLTRSTKKPNSITELVVENAKTMKIVSVEVYEGSGHTHSTVRALLKPGKYIMVAAAGAFGGGTGILKSASRVSKTKASMTVHAEFKPIKKH
jgi:hypothetical protein